MLKYLTIILSSLFICSTAHGQRLTLKRLKKISRGFEYTTQKSYVYSKASQKVFNPLFLPYLYTQTKEIPFRLKKYKEFNAIVFRKNNQTLNSVKQLDSRQCSKVCPNNIEILNLNRSNFKRSSQNSLTFVNNAYEFKDVMKYDYGFCWGHSSITSLLKNLAFFDPDATIQHYDFTYDSNQWREYVLKALVDIYNSVPRVIPFIHNIQELSRLFKDEMKAIVVEKWTQLAIHPRNLKIRFDNKNDYSEQDLLKIVHELKFRIGQGQKPEVIFNIWDSNEWIHVSLVESVEWYKSDRVIKLHLDDNKVFNNFASLAEHESLLIIDLDSKEIHYSNAQRFETTSSRIGRLAFTKSNYHMYNRILPRLVNFCKEKTNCLE